MNSPTFTKIPLRPVVAKILGYRVQPRVDVPSRIKPELAHMFERALRDEADGKSIVMREPRIVRKFPKGPSYW